MKLCIVLTSRLAASTNARMPAEEKPSASGVLRGNDELAANTCLLSASRLVVTHITNPNILEIAFTGSIVKINANQTTKLASRGAFGGVRIRV
jgi:hypothetical protein